MEMEPTVEAHGVIWGDAHGSEKSSVTLWHLHGNEARKEEKGRNTCAILVLMDPLKKQSSNRQLSVPSSVLLLVQLSPHLAKNKEFIQDVDDQLNVMIDDFDVLT